MPEKFPNSLQLLYKWRNVSNKTGTMLLSVVSVQHFITFRSVFNELDVLSKHVLVPQVQIEKWRKNSYNTYNVCKEYLSNPKSRNYINYFYHFLEKCLNNFDFFELFTDIYNFLRICCFLLYNRKYFVK